MKRLIHTIFSLFISALLLSCAGKPSTQFVRTGLSLLSPQLKKEVQQVAKSVVGLNADINYEVTQYNYLQQDGQLVRDPNSPLNYQLNSENGDAGIILSNDTKTLSGGGLIIKKSLGLEPRYTILTSSHLVAPQDTTDIYYLDENGNATDILFTRYVVTNVTLSVRGLGNFSSPARLIVHDAINDLAIVTTETDNTPGIEFSNSVGYDLDLSWGDWVFLFGYPKSVKQMTGGWISESPYRNTLAVDAVVRFGYSGGPVFAITDNAKLAFVGLIKSVPSSMMEYIAPDGTLPHGLRLDKNQTKHFVVQQKKLVDYGTAYFVHPKTIRRFFKRLRNVLAISNLRLDPKYFGN